MTDEQDLGAPVSYLVLADGTPVYDSSGDRAGEVEHVLADEQEDVFHGLVVKTAAGHRFARSSLVEGIYEHGVIISVPADQLPEPSEDGVAQHADDDSLKASLKRAWDWLLEPK
jgi:sporulation protein YlmC with PRC-barrel domain